MSKLRILVIGAHPDDDEIKAGGSAALWSAAGPTGRSDSATAGRGGGNRRRDRKEAVDAALPRVAILRMDSVEPAHGRFGAERRQRAARVAAWPAYEIRRGDRRQVPRQVD